MAAYHDDNFDPDKERARLRQKHKALVKREPPRKQKQVRTWTK